MAAPAYEFEATSPISIGGVLGYAVGDLVPAAVVAEHQLEELVKARGSVPEGAQDTSDERVADGTPGSVDDLEPNKGGGK